MKIVKAEFVKSSSEIEQCPPSDRHEYAFIGRSNVGKSSLINMLTNHGKLAKVSGTPGKTQLINHFVINNEWNLVDLPGYGYARVSKSARKQFDGMIKGYISQRENLVCTFVLLDARHEPQKNDLEFMEWMGQNGYPFAMVFTKIDKLSSKDLNKNQLIYKKRMLETWDALPEIFLTSSVSAHGKDLITNYIDKLNREVIL